MKHSAMGGSTREKDEACPFPQNPQAASPSARKPAAGKEEALFFDLQAVAELCKLTLDPAEEKEIAREIRDLVAFAGQLAEIPACKLEEPTQVVPTKNVFRADFPQTGPDRAALLRNVPEKQDGYIFLPQSVSAE